MRGIYFKWLCASTLPQVMDLLTTFLAGRELGLLAPLYYAAPVLFALVKIAGACLIALIWLFLPPRSAKYAIMAYLGLYAFIVGGNIIALLRR